MFGNADAVRLPGIWQMASMPRLTSASAASATSGLVFAGTETSSKPVLAGRRFELCLVIDRVHFRRDEQRAEPMRVGADLPDHREHVVVGTVEVDAGDVRQMIRVAFAGAGGLGARQIVEHDRHAAGALQRGLQRRRRKRQQQIALLGQRGVDQAC